MKTTLEIPDPIFRRAKSAAAVRGIPLREFVTQAVRDMLAADAMPREKPWRAAFGKLKRLRKESARINRMVEAEFEQIEAEDRHDDHDPRHQCALGPGRGRSGAGTHPQQNR